MAQATLKRVLNDVRTLEPEELREVERAVHALLAPSQQEAERETVLRVLQESGLVKEIKRPKNHPQRPPVPIKGKPLSETIIEERR